MKALSSDAALAAQPTALTLLPQASLQAYFQNPSVDASQLTSDQANAVKQSPSFSSLPSSVQTGVSTAVSGGTGVAAAQGTAPVLSGGTQTGNGSAKTLVSFGMLLGLLVASIAYLI